MPDSTTTLTNAAPVAAPAVKTKTPVKPRATAKPAVVPEVKTETAKAAPKPRSTATTRSTTAKPRTVVQLSAPGAVITTPATPAPVTTKAATATPTQQAGEFKPKTMALVAGLAVALTDKRLGKALTYHTNTTGCLEKTADGKYALTALGASAWTFQRVSKNPTLFTEIANFVKRGGPVPSLWKNQPPLSLDATTRMPNPIFWGSFSSAEMRLAFAALWAK